MSSPEEGRDVRAAARGPGASKGRQSSQFANGVTVRGSAEMRAGQRLDSDAIQRAPRTAGGAR